MSWRAPVASLVAALSGVAVHSACSGQTANSGLGEPMQVSGESQFIAGPLPGTSPPDAGADAADAGTDAHADAALLVTSVTLVSSFIVPGIAGSMVSGLVTDDAVAVGIAVASQGDGYWVVPTQGEDVGFPGQRDFSFTASFNPSDTPGNIDLRVVGIDANGNAGPETSTPVCIESRVPDHGHACIPTYAVPAAVFTLRWDAPFDLDLTVLAPNGLNVNPKTNPLTAPIDAGTYGLTAPEAVGLYTPGAGIIDRDSMGSCVADGWREEDLVFLEYPATGTYEIYADPVASCGQPAVRFTLTIYEPAPDGSLAATFTRSGELLASQTTGGVPPDGGSVAGLFVAEKSFE
jgi:hypothetical protein